MNYSIGMQLTKCKLRETLKISKDQMTVFATINYYAKKKKKKWRRLSIKRNSRDSSTKFNVLNW